MAERVLVFRQTGPLLAEIEPELEMVSWRLNGVGMARFKLAWNDPKCTKSLLEFGNRVLIQFTNGLPDWGGVIDPPRKRQYGAVQVTAYTAEKLLDWRVTAQARYFDSQTPGTIFQKLIEEENGEAPTGITPGNIYDGGTGRTIEVHYHDLLARVQDLATLAGHDFQIAPLVTAGSLTFQGHWYERRGADKRNSVWLVEKANVEGATLDEQGEIANRIVCIGEGTTWTSERLVAADEDEDSQGQYGYREYAEVQSGATQLATLEANAAALLEDRAYPYNRITLSTLNELPARFADYDVGDIVTAQLFTSNAEWAFQAPVRVLAREWKPGEACRLEVEEWQGS